MKKRRFTVGIGLAAVILLAGLAVLVNHKLKLHQSELQRLRQESQELNARLEAAIDENDRLQTQLAGQVETVDSPASDSDMISRIEEGFAQRIRDHYSDSNMEVLGIYPVGEDTQESIRRFYLCKRKYYAEFYLVDYVTGDISDLSKRALGVDIASLNDIPTDVTKGVWPNGDVEWEFQVEDYDGDGEEDILLVTSFYKPKSGAIMLWLCRQESFLPINRHYCGNDTSWQESEFSLLIEEKEGQFWEEQDQEAWSADNVGAWIRNELFAGREEELEKSLQNPKKQLHYTQWRELLDIHVTLAEDENFGQYRVKIPENPYGEEQINKWLTEYYEAQEEYWQRFMGVGIEDDNGIYLSEREREEAGFYYSYSLQPERVDDIMLCLISDSYEYSGGVHGNSNMFAITFDTRSGSPLELEDMVYDVESFYKFVMNYLDENYEAFPWGQQYVRDALFSDGWCFTGYGFRVFLVGGNGAGYYWYEIPYELLLDYLKEEYLPVSRAAKYSMSYDTLETVQMDVDGDGQLDVVSPVREDENLFWSVNGVMTKLELQWQGTNLEELDVDSRIRHVWLERQEDGVTRLFLDVDLYGPDQNAYTGPENRIYVFRIEGETFVYERDYEGDY